MKKIILFLLAMLLLTSLVACNGSEHIVSGDYLLLEAMHSNWDEVSVADDYWSGDKFTLYANGKMDITVSYNLSGDTKTTVYLSEDEVSEIVKLIRSQKFTPDDHSAFDGSAWDIKHYDEKGNVVVDYNGYVAGGKLQELIKILNVAKANSADKNVLLNATQSFVGVNENTGRETWYSAHWTIYYDGRVIYSYNAGDMDAPIVTETNVDKDTIDEICKLMNEQKATSHEDIVFDAEEWKFNYFDKNGKTLKRFDGVIYDFNNLNELAKILSSLVDE